VLSNRGCLLHCSTMCQCNMQECTHDMYKQRNRRVGDLGSICSVMPGDCSYTCSPMHMRNESRENPSASNGEHDSAMRQTFADEKERSAANHRRRAVSACQRLSLPCLPLLLRPIASAFHVQLAMTTAAKTLLQHCMTKCTKPKGLLACMIRTFESTKSSLPGQ
jgi:hypothetical protein